MSSFRKILYALTPAVLAATPGHAQITVPNPDGIRIFEPAYFAEFDPSDALELLFRTPGFNPQERDGGRGLSDVRTNILINGERPPPKGQSVRQQLGEMPVSRVQYLELIDAGARQGLDMQGYPQVVNVVTFPDAPAYYEVISEVRRSGTGDLDQNNERRSEIESTGSFSVGEHEFTLRGDYQERTDQPPANLVAIDPANPEQRISSVNKSESEDYGFDFSGLIALDETSSFSFNGQLSSEESVSYPLLFGDIDSDTPTVIRSSQGEEDDWDLSAEYRRPLGASGTLMLALVDAVSTDDSQSLFLSEELARDSLNSRESGETAIRLLITQTLTDKFTLRTTATSAHNYFDGNFRLFEDGVEQFIDGSSNRVEEDRETIEAAFDWTPAERWTVNGDIGMESYNIQSRTAQTGTQTDAIGEVTVSWRPQARTTWSFEAERSIGQLSFNQFLASSNLSSEILTAGADTLEPQRSTQKRFRYDRRFGDDGILQFTLTDNEVHNPVRQVALSEILIVSQNTSPRNSLSFGTNIQYPLANFGREDLVLSLDGQIADSETIDPVTGEERRISGNFEKYWSVGVRRDPGDGRLAWGFSVQDFVDGDFYSVRSINTSDNNRDWDAYVEWEVIPDVKIRTNLNGPRRSTSLTSLYPGVRMVGLDPSFYTRSENYNDRSFSISIEWRRMENIEIRGSLYGQPRNRRYETLIPFGGLAGDPFIREVAPTPRATLRVRFFS